jgi:hypothetical protein
LHHSNPDHRRKKSRVHVCSGYFDLGLTDKDRLSNGTGPLADETPSNYTLVTHTNAQVSLQQTHTSALSTPKKMAVMDQTAADPVPIFSVPDGQVRSIDPTPPAQPLSSSSGRPDPGMDGDDLPKLSTTVPDILTSPIPGTIKKHVTKRATKRTRTDSNDDHDDDDDDDDDDALPMPKKTARKPEVKVKAAAKKSPAKSAAPTELGSSEEQDGLRKSEESVRHEAQTIVAPADAAPADGADKLTELEESAKKSQTRTKAVPKRSTDTTLASPELSPDNEEDETLEKTKTPTVGNPDVANLFEHGAEEPSKKPKAKRKTASKRPTTKVGISAKPTLGNEQDKLANPTESTQSVDMRVIAKTGGANAHEEETAQPTDREAPKKSKAKKKTAPKKPVTAPARVSTRNRKAPERFENLEKSPPPKPKPTKKGTSKVFDPVFITTNSTSRLGKADMYHMLLEGPAWTSLSVEQQVKLVSMLPDIAENQQLLSRIKAGETDDTRPQTFTISNDCFRTDVAKFQMDLRNGHLAKTWQAAAEQAVIERAAGEYDAWKAEEAELWWGQKSK